MAKTSSTSAPSRNIAAAALVGEDCFLQLAGLADLLRGLPPDADRVELDGETVELADALDEVRSFAMFGGGKAVIVRNADAFVTRFRQQLEEYLAAAPAGAAMLILRLGKLKSNERVYKLLSKVGRIINCDSPKDPVAWIVDHGRSAHKLIISPDAARMLAELVGNDLGRLDNELAKLALNCEGGKVGLQQVTAATAFQREREIWDLTDALGGGDWAGAIARWRQLVQLDSSAEFRAVTWLGLWLENVRKALVMLRRGESASVIGQALRIWPRQRQEGFVQTVRNLGQTGLERALDLLAEIDFQTKTGIGDACQNVERFILTLAAGRGG